jgi:hypothetical protein
MKHSCFFLFLWVIPNMLRAQLRWTEVTTGYGVLPASVRLFKTTDSVEGMPNVAWYIEASLNNGGEIVFDTDTTYKRRFTPAQFYQKNDQPLVVVNGTFFSFQTNQNLNTVVRQGLPISYNIRSVKGRGADSIRQVMIYRSAIGIGPRGADVAWIHSDSNMKQVWASQVPLKPRKALEKNSRRESRWKGRHFDVWPVMTAIGGGPVLLQRGQITISNEEEMMFMGKGFNDRHPRTAMGYTRDGKLIILVAEGRFPGRAAGLTLTQEAQILKDLGCVEALNLDGGGSSCLLVNGKETNKPSDPVGQRAIPAVFMIKKRG